MDTKETQEPEKVQEPVQAQPETQEPEKTQEPAQTQPKEEKKSSLFGTVGKIVKGTKTAIKIGLTILTLGGAYYVYKQVNRSPEEVKEDAEKIRQEGIPQKYSDSPVDKEMADFGSRVGEWALTGEYPSKPPEQISEEAQEIREEIKTKKTGVAGFLKGKGQPEAANAGSKFAEWLKGGRQ